MRILIVEDSLDTSSLMKKILEHYGYQVVIKESSEDAIDYLKKNPDLSLIFMDVSLPKKDGLETTKEVRKMEKYKKIPIVASTAYSRKDMEKKVLNAGCDAMLSKPFTPAELIKMAQDMLGSS